MMGVLSEAAHDKMHLKHISMRMMNRVESAMATMAI